MKIFNLTQNTCLAHRAQIADTAMSRLIGLLNRERIDHGEGLVITQCRSIHMFFMRFAIDVVFIDRSDRVIGCVRNIKPFRMSPYFWRAASAIELPVGVIDQSRTGCGDKIGFGE